MHPSRRRLAVFLVPPLALAAGLALLLWRRVPRPGPGPETGAEPAAPSVAPRVRFAPASATTEAPLFPGELAVRVRRGGRWSPLAPGASVRAGDELELVFQGSRPRHLELRVVDEHGREVLHHPAPGTVPPLAPGEPVPRLVPVEAGAHPAALVVRLSDRPFATEGAGVGERHRIELPRE